MIDFIFYHPIVLLVVLRRKTPCAAAGFHREHDLYAVLAFVRRKLGVNPFSHFGVNTTLSRWRDMIHFPSFPSATRSVAPGRGSAKSRVQGPLSVIYRLVKEL